MPATLGYATNPSLKYIMDVNKQMSEYLHNKVPPLTVQEHAEIEGSFFQYFVPYHCKT
jgi:hypothetical protein